MGSTHKVGELLIHLGVIDEAQLATALSEQHRWGRRLGVTLIKLGMVEENHLVRALAQQLGLPATSLAGRRIAPEVVALVPARVAAQHNVIPLFVKQTGDIGKLFLGMEDPSKLEVLDDLCFRTGLEIQPVMMGPTEVSQALDRYYSQRRHARPSAEAERGAGETTIEERSLGLAESRTIEEAGEDSNSDVSGTKNEPVAEQAAGRSADLVAELLALSHETEKTRVVVKAITQILVEKEILDLDEIQARIAKLKTSGSSS